MKGDYGRRTGDLSQMIFEVDAVVAGWKVSEADRIEPFDYLCKWDDSGWHQIQVKTVRLKNPNGSTNWWRRGFDCCHDRGGKKHKYQPGDVDFIVAVWWNQYEFTDPTDNKDRVYYVVPIKAIGATSCTTNVVVTGANESYWNTFKRNRAALASMCTIPQPVKLGTGNGTSSVVKEHQVEIVWTSGNGHGDDAEPHELIDGNGGGNHEG